MKFFEDSNDFIEFDNSNEDEDCSCICNECGGQFALVADEEIDECPLCGTEFDFAKES